MPNEISKEDIKTVKMAMKEDNQNLTIIKLFQSAAQKVNDDHQQLAALNFSASATNMRIHLESLREANCNERSLPYHVMCENRTLR